MSKQSRILIGKIALVFATLIVCILGARWISEAYFFDKFYYYKSVAHGYWIPGESLTLKDFGLRAKDIQHLQASKQKPEQLFPELNGKSFTVAVIGDSYVWGQGIREKDRFVSLLENRLNEVYPTRVLSLALCGDGVLDNYIKYRLVKNSKIDFFVFAIVDNDLLLSNDRRYDLNLAREALALCQGRPYLYSQFYDSQNPSPNGNYTDTLNASFSDRFGNLCLFRTIAGLLPKENSIYFNFNRYNNDFLNKTEAVLRENGLKVVSPSTYPDIFKKYKNHKSRDFYVSRIDTHPSPLANRMFADVLFYEISHHPSFLQKTSFHSQ